MLKIITKASEILNNLEQEFFEMKKSIENQPLDKMPKEELSKIIDALSEIYRKIQVVSNIVENQIKSIQNKLENKKDTDDKEPF